MTDEQKQKADELISNLELATGSILLRDKLLTPVVTEMRIQPACAARTVGCRETPLVPPSPLS